MVECQLPKLKVAGSNPVSRSIRFRGPASWVGPFSFQIIQSCPRAPVDRGSRKGAPVSLFARAFLIVSLLSLVAGCTIFRPLAEIESESLGTEQVLEKSYTLGVEGTAFVGEAVVQVTEAVIERYRDRARHRRATDDFVMTGGEITLRGEKGVAYPVRAVVTIHRTPFDVIDISETGADTFSVLVDYEGRLHNKVMKGRKFSMWSFVTRPSGVRLQPVDAEETRQVIASGTTYELIYGGTDGRTLSLTYREYRGADRDRPAFFQNLLYEANTDEIRWRNTRIRVHEATGERLVFTVVED